MTTDRGAPASNAAQLELLRQIAREVGGWRRPLLLTHERPDGDALGSLLALREFLAAGGAKPIALLYEPPPGRYGFLPLAEHLHVWQGPDDPVLKEADGVLIVDTCAWGQLSGITPWLRKTELPIAVLDHHRTCDADLGRWRAIDPEAAAGAVLVYRLAEAAGWPLTPLAAKALFVGIATDTGWFRFSNTNAESLRIAARLLDAGVDIDALHKAIYLSDPVTTVRGKAAALGGLDFFADGRIAIISVGRPMLEALGATPADLDEVVNTPLAAATVEVSAVLVAWESGIVKCSLRSKGAVDVAALAAGFGGGGHARAAGVRIPGTLEEVRKRIVEATEAALAG
jgi:phosphoesterase RecJ-like protein